MVIFYHKNERNDKFKRFLRIVRYNNNVALLQKEDQYERYN